jgi:4-hydroxy-tetrahydrodipicolinate synthase
MTKLDWTGVLPAITTPFHTDGQVDHGFLTRHASWMIDAGCKGIVALGSLGEGATLTFEEKSSILNSLVQAVGHRAPVIASISALSTSEAVKLAQVAESVGCRGLMVLPPYVYPGDWPEIEGHLSAVIRATSLSCMLYNNPIAYGVDLYPHQVAQMANNHGNLHSIKESSADIRRITWIRSLLGDRLRVLVGVDDVLVEGVAAGAEGWIAGLVNALPKESVRLFELAQAGSGSEVRNLYEWFLPLLRLDTVPTFVQLIKLVQQEVGMGTEIVRLPRRPIEGNEREQILAVIREQLQVRPTG